MRVPQILPVASLAFAILTAPANAATVEISLAGSIPEPGLIAEFDTISPGGTVYYDRTESIIGSWWSPWKDTAYDMAKYVSVQGGSWGEYSFSALQKSITLLWGSPDSYNTLSFWKDGGEVGSLTGLTLTSFLGVAKMTTSYVTLSLTDELFDTVRFASGYNAFEFANFTSTPAPVPLPAAGLLLVGAIGGLGVIARKRRMAA